ncbi:hypothetical protein [uncultured Pseudokineococcus sp.]|uniref:hypothetical protein n=1 Tax=uncultured Pseudokineococcus sp. TaxID=1642928 RepID=UPI002625A240|nr:hypothetical protein [uncultured Pseudokineococcus sp.]
MVVEGRSGAGKTTLAAALGRDLGAPVLRMDDLYPGWDGLAAASARLARDVLPGWRRGRPVRARRWDWALGRWSVDVADDVVVPACPLLVVEGVGAGVLDAAAAPDVLVWVEAPDDVRRRRALVRDGDAYAPHWDRWAAQEAEHLAACDPRSRADVVVRTA